MLNFDSMKVLFLAPYPLKSAPSQRFRFELFFQSMENEGIGWDFQSFLSDKGWHVIYSPGNSVSKIHQTVLGFVRRFLVLFRLSSIDIVFIHRELTPFGPPIFEWIITKVLGKKIIYDFDDAIWLTDLTNESATWRILKWRSKVSSICGWSWKVSAGNEYLRNYAAQFCSQTYLIPTVVDTAVHTPIISSLVQTKHDITPQLPTIGWTGSHSTLPYLDELIPVLQELENEFEFNFMVIANKNPSIPLRNFEFIQWSQEREAEDLSKIDIGVMPLKDDEWAKGKCGFKLIQYMSMEVPPVASPVGVNSQIVRHGENGYLAASPNEWKEVLTTLLKDNETRRSMGKSGRALIENSYSVSSLESTFLSLFDVVAESTSAEE